MGPQRPGNVDPLPLPARDVVPEVPIRAKLAREVNEPADTGTAVCDPTAPATVAYEGLSFSFGNRQLYEDLSCAFAFPAPRCTW